MDLEVSDHKFENVLLKSGEAIPNLWNIHSSDGNLSICNMNEYISFNIDLFNTKYLTESIAGYPEIGYGSSGWNYKYKNQSYKIKFPLKIKKLLLKKTFVKSISEIVDYSPKELPHNIAYDLWIKKTVDGEPRRNDVEIMIHVYNKKLQPKGRLIYKNVLIPVGKSGDNRKWNVYAGENVTGIFTVSFLLNEKSGMNEKTININDFINTFIKYFPDHKIDDYYIMGIEYGMEFGNSNLKSSKIGFNINNMEIKRGIFRVKII